jgi:hypothetical protein
MDNVKALLILIATGLLLYGAHGGSNSKTPYQINFELDEWAEKNIRPKVRDVLARKAKYDLSQRSDNAVYLRR